eukprot:TRINITY_DN33788_c0_g1_i1.p2 TRINITY_DN33788_c0_g1~~TRINITY_DN33788_c0_g1_i1.p2  ORF type:complete len:149 (-),score=48.47 TRINITY_DN33788_c0_g1_i1:131-511(-)
MLRSLVGSEMCIRDSCKYEGGGVFLPHFDYGHSWNADKSTLQTVMFYLDAPQDADTVVYTDDQAHYVPGNPSHEIGRWRPVPGSVLIFNPRITHAGDRLQQGDVKHILRTELVYEREADSYTNDTE